MKRARIFVAAAMLAATVGLVWVAGSGAATGDGPKGDVLNIAAAVKKGDMDGARKMAATVAKKIDSLEDVTMLHYDFIPKHQIHLSN